MMSDLRKRPLDGPQHSLRSPKRRRTAVSEQNLLCQDCRQIDFTRVLNADLASLQKEENGTLLADLGTRCNDSSITRGCSLCNLLHQSRPHASNSEFQLRVYSYLKASESVSFLFCSMEHLLRDTPCLGVVPSGSQEAQPPLQPAETAHLFCLEGDPHSALVFTPRILGLDADLLQVKEWLSFCATHHESCQTREGSVSALKLMDCDTYDVISAPENPSYVALSYVWGAPAHLHENTETPGVQKPDAKITKTVRDAAVATKALGYQYLWVDKHCIDQGNAEESHNQINQMDSIYRCADVTIIAACGQDCHYGLPGVNGTPRRPQPVASVGNVKVFSSMPHPRHHVQSSKWAERGWTLQEAVLSRRRLVFTDDQLYFECDSMQFSESPVPNLDLIYNSGGNFSPLSQRRLLSVEMGHHFSTLDYSRRFSQEDSYKKLVNQYTKRALTFEEDRPRAFLGIIRHFAKEDFHELWGIFFSGGVREDRTKCFTRGLLWAHSLALERRAEARQDSHIDMKLDLPGAASVPTWSWMAWRGEISFPLLFLDTRNFTSLIHGIRLELGPNSWVDFRHFSTPSTKRPLPAHITPPKRLLLDVDCVKLSDILIDKAGNLSLYGWKTECYVSSGPFEPKALYKLCELGKLELVTLAFNGLPRTTYYLMMVEKGVDFDVRIGLCVLSGVDLKPPSGQRRLIRLG
jgi:Heterokaryon incompatibility protein (HET)